MRFLCYEWSSQGGGEQHTEGKRRGGEERQNGDKCGVGTDLLETCVIGEKASSGTNLIGLRIELSEA